MSYEIAFVGLVCFYRQADGSRLVLLPDGRHPPRDIAIHEARLVIGSDRVISGSGWESGVSLLEERMEFKLPECELEISGAKIEKAADKPAPVLDVSKHDVRLPNLKKMDGNFAIDPVKVRAIVKFRINSGNLEAFRRPGSNDENPDVAMVTRLTVDHHENITITVRERDSEIPRTITLLPNTEIVISNIEREGEEAKTGKHIRLYEKLSSNPVSLDAVTVADISSLGQPRMHSTQPFFRIARGIGAGADCGNTGCCPTPGGP